MRWRHNEFCLMLGKGVYPYEWTIRRDLMKYYYLKKMIFKVI